MEEGKPEREVGQKSSGENFSVKVQHDQLQRRQTQVANQSLPAI